MTDEQFIEKYEELLNKGYCDCNEMNCIDNDAPRRILSIIKNLQIENKEKLELFLERYQEYPATKIWVSNDKAGYKSDKVEVITYYKDDFITFTSDPYLKLTYQNQSLCIIEKEQTFTDCDYLYVPYQVKLEVPDEVKLIIESSPISQNTNLLYRTLELKEGYLVTLKWKDDDFDTLTLPF